MSLDFLCDDSMFSFPVKTPEELLLPANASTPLTLAETTFPVLCYPSETQTLSQTSLPTVDSMNKKKGPKQQKSLETKTLPLETQSNVVVKDKTNRRKQEKPKKYVDKKPKTPKIKPAVQKPIKKNKTKLLPDPAVLKKNLVMMPKMPEVQFEKPANLLFPQIGHTFYLCQKCWDETKKLPVINKDNKMDITVSLCMSCVGLNTQMIAMYIDAMCRE